MNNSYFQDGETHVAIQFNTLRNISTKEDNFYGRKILVGLAPISELLKLGKDTGDGDLTTNVADKSSNVRAVKTRKDGRGLTLSLAYQKSTIHLKMIHSTSST